MSKEASSNQQENGGSQPLFQEFPAQPFEDWRKLCETTLKGAPFDKRLVTKTYEGIDLQPLYRQADIDDLPHLGTLPGFTPYLRGAEALGYKLRGWEVCQEIRNATPEEFNRALRVDLERGQTAINVPLDYATRQGLDPDEAPARDVGRDGVSLASVADLDQALEAIDLETTPLMIQGGAVGFALMALVVGHLRHEGKSPGKLSGCIGMDPLGALAKQGEIPAPLANAYDAMAQMTLWARGHAPDLQTICVDGQPYHDGGASTTQELAFVLAAAIEYLRALGERGLGADDVAPRIRVSLSLGSNFFMEVARLRAARLLWAKVVEAFGGGETAQRLLIHARTSSWNQTVIDPYVNMLRTTTEAFSGVVGGCASLHVSPFDEAIRPPDEFSRRIARNTHTILREECMLDRPVDPAGGSWFVESLTDQVAQRTWALLQEVEKQGGLYQALLAGFPQAQVATVAQKRAHNAAVRKDVVVGTNMYANPKEEPLVPPAVDAKARQRERGAALASYRESIDADVRDAALKKLADTGADKRLEGAVKAAMLGATLGQLTAAVRGGDNLKATATPVCIRRGAEPYEQLRSAAADYTQRTGARPAVFLANMGPVPQHKARADFATGFLEVGGFEVIANPGFSSAEDAAHAAIESGAGAVVICSTDATYPDLVPPLVRELKARRPSTVVLLAGYPADQVDAHKAAGVDDFIHLRANCYELLTQLQKTLGVVS